MYDETVPHFEKTLAVAEKWIDKAVEFAKSKNFDPDTLLTARLAPDMFPLVRQFQSICDQTKLVCSRLTGKEVPSHPDTEETWDELRTRVAAARELLKSFKPADFEGAEKRHVTMAWMPGKYLLGKDYLHQFALVNFHFHLSIAYAILRHNGVPLGKVDFIGGLPFHDG
ncbi:MAG: DUF1993 domain-containing protein [Labilithrix sp.]